MENRIGTVARAWMGTGVIASGIWLGTPANAAATPVVTPIARVSAADTGKTLTVQGVVISTQNFSRGFRYELADPAAQITLLVNEDDYDSIRSRDQLNVGAVVQVTGKIRAVSNTLQIVPGRGRHVSVISVATNPWRKYDLGAMNGNDHNAMVWVQGTILDVGPYVNIKATPYQYGTQLLVADGTGVQRVMLRDVVARHVTQRGKLVVGQPVSVIGKVYATSKVGIEIRAIVPSDVVAGVQPQ